MKVLEGPILVHVDGVCVSRRDHISLTALSLFAFLHTRM